MNVLLSQGLENAKALLRSRFVRDGSVLAVGQAIAQGASLITAPIMSRLYDPAAYGLLALFVAVFTFVGLPASLQYDKAVILPKEDADALALTKGGLVLSIGCALGIFLATLLPLKAWLQEYEAVQVVDLLPLMAILVVPTTLTLFLSGWLARKQAYGALSSSRLFGTLSSSALAIFIGLVWHNQWGLFVGYTVGAFVTLGIVLRAVNRIGGKEFLAVQWSAVVEQLRRYHRFPVYSLPNQLSNQVIRQAPIFLLSSLAGATSVGLLSMSNRLLEAPTSLFVGSLSEVFVQRASKQYAQTGECYMLYTRTFWALVALGLPSVFIVTIWAPDLFAWLLGERWRAAGEYSRILCWLSLFRAVCGPLSTMFIVAQRQVEDLVLQVSGLVVTLGAMMAAYSMSPTPISILSGYVVGYCSMYTAYLVRGFALARGQFGAAMPLSVDHPPSNE